MEFKSYSVKGPRETALSYLADKLTELGYVKEDYKQSLLEREKNFPTGIYLPDSINVAIPHTETYLVNQDLFVIAIPEEPIIFNQIDEPENELPIDMIFLFAIKNSNEYLSVLASLTENLLNEEFLEYLKNRDLENIEEFLKLHVLN